MSTFIVGYYGGTTPHLVKKMNWFWIFNFFLLRAVNKHPNCIKMKFEGDLTSIMVTRDFLWQQLPLFLPSLGKKMAVVWMAVMVWVAEAAAEGWCWLDLWTPWPPSPGNLPKLKPIYIRLASRDVFQRCLRGATQNANESPSMVSFGVTAQKEAFLELIQWHACTLVALQFNNCTCQGHPGCTGEDGLLSWRAQHECTGTRGQEWCRFASVRRRKH